MMEVSKIEKKMISVQMQPTEMPSKDYSEAGGFFTIIPTSNKKDIWERPWV